MNSHPDLIRFYQAYLIERDSAGFVSRIGLRYHMETLHRLARNGSAVQRRAAVLALGFVGDFRSNEVFANALHDADRCVRLLAEEGIRDIWQRAGNDYQRKQLCLIKRYNAGGLFPEALRLARRLARLSPAYAEAWNQAAMAGFFLQQYTTSVRDCRRALALNPYQFEAAVGLGNCYLKLEHTRGALRAFRRALRVNPNLEAIRLRVANLRRAEEQY